MTTRTQSFTIPAGESATFNALQYFTLASASGSGLTWSEKGRNEPNPLSVRQVYGERASGEIGQIEIRNPTGASVTGVYTTSDRAISWSADGTSSSVTITGATATIPVSAVQLPTSLGSKTMVNSVSTTLATDELILAPLTTDIATGTLPTNTSNLTSADLRNYVGAWVCVFGGSVTGATFNLSLSFDGGTSFVPVVADRRDSGSNPATSYTGVTVNATAGLLVWVAFPALVSSVAGVRLRVAASAGTFTTGPSAFISPSQVAPPPTNLANVGSLPSISLASSTFARIAVASGDGLQPVRVYHGSGAGMTNAATAVLKASANAVLTYLEYNNLEAAVRHLHLYNLTTPPTFGTSVPLASFPCAASTVTRIPVPATGWRFGTGLSVGITTDMAPTPATGMTTIAGGNGVLLHSTV